MAEGVFDGVADVASAARVVDPESFFAPGDLCELPVFESFFDVFNCCFDGVDADGACGIARAVCLECFDVRECAVAFDEFFFPRMFFCFRIVGECRVQGRVSIFFFAL